MSIDSVSRLTPVDEAVVRDIRPWGEQGPAAVPRLLEALRTRSWAVRRHVVEQLAGSGAEAAAAMCLSLRTDRVGESRLAALVDALVASTAEIDALVVGLLSDANHAVICDALQIVGRRRISVAASRAVELSSHEDDNVAVASIEALGQLGDDAALTRLLELAREGSFFRSFPAIDVLGRMGDPRAVETLLSVLGDPLKGQEAVRSLGRLGDETALGPLLDWLSASQAPAVRIGAVAIWTLHERLTARFGATTLVERALANHAEREGIEVRLRRSLTGADAAEKTAIGRLLGLVSSSASVESLFALVVESGDVADAAVKSLGRLARLGSVEVIEQLAVVSLEAGLRIIPELAGVTAAVPWLIECLGDAEPQARVAACDALAKTGDPRAVPALFDLLAEGDLSLSQAATAALQSLGAAQTEQLALAAAGGSGLARHAALRILAYFGSPRALPVLLAAARDSDERAREIALTGLALIDGQAAMEAILEASHHASARTRAAAIRALGNVEAAPAVGPRLVDALGDDDAWVRYQACQAMGNVGDVSVAPLLAARLDDSAGQVRVAAIDALARLRGPLATEVLERAVHHDDIEVRRAALTGMGFTRMPSAIPLLVEAVGSADTATRLVALSSLAGYQSAAALPCIVSAAQSDEDPSVQNAALELLAELPIPEASAALIELLAIESRRPRVGRALRSHAQLHAPQMLAALHGASAPIAEVIVGALSRLPKAEAEAQLLRGLTLPNAHARRAAARALRIVFADGNGNVDEALASSAVRDPDPEVRRIASARSS